MNCFIIGNGFDIAHNLPTSYNDFHKYLIETYLGTEPDYLSIPSVLTTHHGDYIEKEQVASMLCNLMTDIEGGEWKDFESSLGQIDLISLFDDLGEVIDRHGDRNLWAEAANNEERTQDLMKIIPIFKELFSEWINTIEIKCHPLRDFIKIINPEEDFFITFNYTHTLEEIYGCKNVVHFHGEQGKEIIVGHNGNYDYSSENPKVPTGCFGYLQEIYDGLKKDTSRIIFEHNDDIKKIINCSKIYSFGFSFSEVDIPYIREFCSSIKDKKTEWALNSFDKGKNYEEILKKCGFNGVMAPYYSVGKNSLFNIT